MNTANPTPFHAATIPAAVAPNSPSDIVPGNAPQRTPHSSSCAVGKPGRWSALSLLGLWFTLLPATAAPTTQPMQPALPRWIAQTAPAESSAPSLSVVPIPTPSRAYISERQQEERDASEVARNLLARPPAKAKLVRLSSAALALSNVKVRFGQNQREQGRKVVASAAQSHRAI